MVRTIHHTRLYHIPYTQPYEVFPQQLPYTPYFAHRIRCLHTLHYCWRFRRQGQTRRLAKAVQRRRLQSCLETKGVMWKTSPLRRHPGVSAMGNDNEGETADNRPPDLRRAGSSSDYLLSSFHGLETSSSLIALKDDIDSLESSGTLATLGLLLKGTTVDFCRNGLPWEGPVCRSKRAGLSGILYALPALVANGHPYDQIMWTVQACLSVIADYCYICQDSFWHGVDRYFAIFNLLMIIARAWNALTWIFVALAFILVSCYMGANRAKNQSDVKSWHFYHCLWHVTGGTLACLAVYMIHTVHENV